MSFDTRAGTRGARQPAGFVLRWGNKMMAGRIRKGAVAAQQLHGEERAEAWRQIVAAAPRFSQYEVKTDRELPIIRLVPRSGQEPPHE